MLETNNYLFAGSDSGIFRSSDFGVHWEDINSGDLSGIERLMVERLVRNKAGDLFIAARNGLGTIAGVYRSTDNGTEWTRLPGSMRTIEIAIDSSQAIITCVYNPMPYLYRSTNNGITWVQVDSTPGSDHSSEQIVVDSKGDLYGYEDLRLLWKHSIQLNKWVTILPYPATIHSLALDEAGRIYIGKDSMVLASSNEGLTWDTLYTLPRYAYAANIQVRGSLVFVKERFRVRISTDRGQTWEYCDTTMPYREAISIHMGRTGTLYIGGTETEIFRSLDTGRRWLDVNNSLPASSMMSVGFGTDDYVFAAGSGQSSARTQFFRSSNGGNSWSGIGCIPNLKYESFYSLPTGEVFAPPYPPPYSNADSGFYRSTDNGATWEKQNFPIGDCADARFASDRNNNVYAVAKEYYVTPDPNRMCVFRSSDRGATWNLQSTITGRNSIINGHNSILNFAISPDNALWLGMDSGIYRSTDSGTSWTRLRAWAPIVIDSTGEVYLGFNPNIYRYDLARDTALLVYKIPGVYSSFAVAGNRLFVSKDSEIVVSSDRGKTWTTLAKQGIPAIPYPSGAFEYLSTDRKGNLWAANLGVFKMSFPSQVESTVREARIPSLYPNPVSTVLNILLSDGYSAVNPVHAVAVNTCGVSVEINVVKGFSPDSWSFDVLSLNPGVYCLRLLGGAFIAPMMFVVAR